MNTDDNRIVEEQLTSLLVDYDEALAAGSYPHVRNETGTSPELRQRLERGLECLQLLEEVWPRRLPSSSLFSGFSSNLGASPVRLGSNLGRFQIRREIGRGTFGIVYLACDPRLGRDVALKIARATVLADPHLRERFQREARAAASLDHPNLVPVYDAGEIDSVYYIASAYCPGITLADWLKKRTELVPVNMTAKLVATLAHAVQHAHNRGILHRDLKPSNILLQTEAIAQDGESAKANPIANSNYVSCALPAVRPFILKITDFGLAKLLVGSAESDTQSGVIVGTPNYMAPEQAEGKPKEIGTTTDVYALGAILYELLTGRPPFQSESTLGTLLLIRTEEPLALKRLRPKLPRDLETICLRCLQKEPGRRYPGAGALAEDLERFLAGKPIRARPTGTVERSWKWAKRRPALAALLVLIGIVSGLGFPGVTVLWLRAEQERQAKELQSQLAEEARNQVKTEAQIAKAVGDFLQFDLLGQADPGAQPDRGLTVRAALDRAAERVTGRFAEQPLVEAEIRRVIGQTYLNLGVLAAAEPHLVRSLELRQRELGEDKLETIIAMTDLGRLRQSQGRYADAEPLLVRVMEKFRERYGEEHRDTLTAMNNLGSLYGIQGKNAQAEPLYLRALEMSRRVRGEEHLQTQNIICHLANVYLQQRRYAEAEPLYLKALAVDRRLGRQERPVALATMSGLAVLYSRQHKYAKAEPLFSELLELRRRVQGEEHPDTLEVLAQLGASYFAQGKLDMAEQFTTRALEGQRRVLGKEHTRTLQSLSSLATLYQVQEKYAAAEPLFVEVLESRRRSSATTPTQLANALIDLGANMLHEQRYAAAEPLLRECLTIREQELPDDWRRFNAQSLLGHALAGQAKYADAEPLLLAAYQGLKSCEKSLPDHAKSIVTKALNRIVQLYEAWGKPDQAADWRARR